MKTLELISILSPKELKALDIDLEQKSKTTTHKALQFCAQQTAIDKTDFFKCLFDKPYSVAKDYLLRNEIRLLNQAIEDFIVRQAIQKKENDWWNKKLLLQHYLSKNNTKLFDEEWQQCYKKATAEGLHFFLFELLCLRAQFVSQHLSVNETNYTELYTTLAEASTAMDNLSMDIQYTYRVYLTFAQRTLFGLTAKKTATPASAVQYTGDVFQLERSAVINFCKGRIYDLDLAFEEKQFFYQQLIKLYADEPQNLAIAYGNLGVEYFVRSDFQHAFHNYNAAYDIVQKNNIPFDAKLKGVLFNLISSAVSIGELDKAIAIFNEHKAVWETQSHLIHNLQRIIAIAYLAKGEYNNAFEFMPHNINERGKNEYYYYRAVYALGYLLSGDFELALRETENAYRALRTNPFEEGDFEKLFLAIKHFIKYKADKKGKKSTIIDYLDQEKHIGFHLKELIIKTL